uniref:AMP-dependent synthetase/ligase domain-containing protein n=1 Tax=Alexandrium catenella TaxID=2925 RepID=A0A7S1RFZ4_ALECA
MVKAFGAGLRALGLEPQPDGDFDTLEGKFKILMYEDTCADWIVCAHGALSQALVVATCYATLGIDSVVNAVQEGSIPVVVCNRNSLKALLELKDQMPTLEAVVYLDFNLTPEECKEKPQVDAGDIKVLSLDEVIELGKSKPMPPTQPKPEHVAVLMYTSGSTGKPKGVMVRHSQLLATVAACNDQFGSLLDFSGGETFLGYLPLAHILELTAETLFYGMGSRIGYADPKTLMSGPEKCYPVGALEEFKPTLMAGVPKVWETFKKGAEAKLAKGGDAMGFIFKVALRMKKAAMRSQRETPLFDKLVFKKFKKMIGGKMKFTLSGGGAISGEVQEWVRACFGCPLVQGYGLTETCGASCVQHPFDPSVGIAGSVLSSVEFTLHSESEITDNFKKPYLATDTEHNGQPCSGRGEVWIRGPSVTSGYYKMKDKTAEEFGEDGWFHTGDIGIFTPQGQLKIVDRKKNLVKLKGGEYVALELMNTTYSNADIVNTDAGGVCSYGDHSIDRPVAFVQCKEKELKALAEEAGVTGKEGEELCHDTKVRAAVKAQLDKVAKAAKLPALMNVIAVMPVVEPWTSQNGCLTATSKLVPKEVWAKHAEDLEFLKTFAAK